MTDSLRGATVLRTLQLSEELRRLHAAIPQARPDAQLRDDFFEQCVALERAIGGGTEFEAASRRVKTLNRASGWIALPILLAVVAVIAVGKFVPDVDVFALIIDNVAAVIAVATVLIAVVIGISVRLRVLRARLLGDVYPRLLRRAFGDAAWR